jgi:O-antigen ligase
VSIGSAPGHTGADSRKSIVSDAIGMVKTAPVDSPVGRSWRRMAQAAAGAFLGAAFAFYPVVTAIGVLFLAAASLVVANCAAALQLLLILRPSADILTRIGIPMGSIQINLPGAMGLFVIAAGLFSLAGPRLKGRSLHAGGPPVLAFSLVVALAAAGSLTGYLVTGPSYLALGLKEAIRLTSYLVFYLALVNLLRDGFPETRLLQAIYLGLIVPAAWATWQFTYFLSQGFYTGPPQAVPHGRLLGTFYHPSSLGLFLVQILLLTLTLLRSGRRTGIPRGWLIASIPLCAFLLVFTFSRGAWLVLAFGLVLKTLFSPRRMLGPILFVVLVGGIVFGPRVVARFSDVHSHISLTRLMANREMENSFEWRVYNWLILISVGMEKPILGHGTFTTAAVNPNLSGETRSDARGFVAHNEFVGYFVEHGLVGVAILTAYFVILLRWILRLRRRLRARGDPDADMAELGLETLGGFLLLSILSGDPLSHTSSYYYVIVILALLRAAELRAGEAEDGSP